MNVLGSFDRSSIAFRPAPTVLTGSVWINAKREFKDSNGGWKVRWNHKSEGVFDNEKFINEIISDASVNLAKPCITILAETNGTLKFQVENVDCNTVKANAICRVDPIPITTTTTTTTAASTGTYEIPGANIPKLPCVRPLLRKKRESAKNVASSQNKNTNSNLHKKEVKGEFIG